MSRSYKKEYTKSKRFDKTCRNHGGCPYCEDNRLHKHNKQPKLNITIINKLKGKSYLLDRVDNIECDKIIG